jgi:hypothetical protein
MSKTSIKLSEEAVQIAESNYKTAMEFAFEIGKKYPDILKNKYKNSVPYLSRALGPVLTTLVRKHQLEDDGTKWPRIRKYRKLAVQQSNDDITIDQIAIAYSEAGLAKDETDGLRILAKIALEDHKNEFKETLAKLKTAKEELARLKDFRE